MEPKLGAEVEQDPHTIFPKATATAGTQSRTGVSVQRPLSVALLDHSLTSNLLNFLIASPVRWKRQGWGKGVTQNCWNDSRTQERGWLPSPVTPEGMGSPTPVHRGASGLRTESEKFSICCGLTNSLSGGSRCSHELGHNTEALKLHFPTASPNPPSRSTSSSPSKAGPAPSRSCVHPQWPCLAQALGQLHPMHRDQRSLLHALFLSSLGVNLGYNSLSAERETGHCPVWSCCRPDQEPEESLLPEAWAPEGRGWKPQL